MDVVVVRGDVGMLSGGVPEVTAYVRRAGGELAALTPATLGAIKPTERISLSVSNPSKETLFVRLLALDEDDDVERLGRTLTIEAGKRRETSVAATAIPSGFETFLVVAGTDRAEIAAALARPDAAARLLYDDLGLTVLSVTERRRKLPRTKGAESDNILLAALPGFALTVGPGTRRQRKKTTAKKTTAKKTTAKKTTAKKTTAKKTTAKQSVPAKPAEDGSRTVHARLDAPRAVAADKAFVLTAGIRPDPQPDVESDVMPLPEATTVIEVHLLAFGFSIAAKESWRQELHVTDSDRWPTADWHVTAAQPSGNVQVRSLEVKFAVDGQVIGFARRSIAVGRTAADAQEVDIPTPAGSQFTPPPTDDKADLTITISRPEHASAGVFLASLDSPHVIETPDRALTIDLGADGQEFTRRLVEDVEQREGLEELEDEIRGAGRKIAEKLGPEVWRAIAAAARSAKESGRTDVAILLLTAEPHVPWELAYMREPLNPKRPAFLGAQAAVGRWPIVSTEPPPEGWPTPRASIQTIAVISGKYKGKRGELKHAEAEAARLGKEFGAEQVEASMAGIRALFKRQPTPSLLHFAMHGKADPLGFEEGLITLEGRTITPNQVKGSDLNGSPFVFLNACQVGQGDERLGDYAGLAEAFLDRGACGVVAPLWKIKDEVAAKIALSFYRRVFAKNEQPANVLRDERKAWADEPTSSTFLAYQYWGHPTLQLTRETEPP